MSTNGTLILEQQECEGNYDFESVQHFMTKGFLSMCLLIRKGRNSI